jgi:hypothetical protein
MVTSIPTKPCAIVSKAKYQKECRYVMYGALSMLAAELLSDPQLKLWRVDTTVAGFVGSTKSMFNQQLGHPSHSKCWEALTFVADVDKVVQSVEGHLSFGESHFQ